MATVRTQEQEGTTPPWTIARTTTYKTKLMDENPLVPFNQLLPGMQKRQKGRLLAYTYTLDDPKRSYVYGSAVNAVRKHVQGHTGPYTVVDLGAGNGRNTIKTATMLHNRTSPDPNHLHLIEQSGAALDEARQYFGRNGFADPLSINTTRTSIHFYQRDITNTGLPSQSADAVTCVNVWHHLPTWEKLMASAEEINRLLKPRGLFVIVDTRPLPPLGFKRKKIEAGIKGALNPEQFVVRAKAEGLVVGEDEAAGIADFCREDAFKAFENALTREQFEETLRKSALSPSLVNTANLLSPNLLLRFIYPPMNLAWGIKKG